MHNYGMMITSKKGGRMKEGLDFSYIIFYSLKIERPELNMANLNSIKYKQ